MNMQHPITVPIYNFSAENLSKFTIWPPAAILDFEKKNRKYGGLCIGWSTMSMPNFAKIRWAVSKPWTEMWFVGSNLVDLWHLTKMTQFLTLRKNKKIYCRLVFRHKKHFHANFCQNLRSVLQDFKKIALAQLFLLNLVRRASLWEL